MINMKIGLYVLYVLYVLVLDSFVFFSTVDLRDHYISYRLCPFPLSDTY